MAITRIKNNQITDSTIVASGKVVAKSVTAGLLEDNLTYGSNLTVSGNLTVNGTSTTVNSTTVSVDDPILVLAPDATGAGALDLGFLGERGDDTNIAFIWDESDDEFAVAFTSSTNDDGSAITVTDYADLHAGGAAFDDNVTVGGTFAVTGATTFTGDITAGNIDSSTLDTTGNVSVGGTLGVTGATTLSSTLAAGNTTITGTLSTSGAATLASASITGAATVGTTLGVTGATTLGSSVDITGLLSADGGIDVDGVFTVADTTGNISTTGTLNVDGASTLNSVTLDALSTFDAGGNKLTNLADPTSAQDAATKAYIDSALSAGWVLSDGTTTQTIDVSASDTLTVSGTTNEITAVVSATDTLTIGLPDDVTIGNNLTVTTNATVGGTLGVTGATTLSSTLAAGNTTITGTAGVSGNATVGGTLGVTGAITGGAALNITGLASLDGGIDVDGVFTVADTTGNISTTGTLNVDGASTLNNVTLDASTTFDAGANKLTNVADPTVNQDAATKKYVDDTAANASALSIAGDTGTDTVTVGTDTMTFSGTANEIVTAVTDNEVTISLPDDVTIGNNLTVTGDLTVSGTTTTVNSTTVEITDPVYTIGTNTVDDNKDRGVEFKYNDGAAKVGFFGFDDSAGTFTALTSATNTAEVFSGTAADVVFGDATIVDLTASGNAAITGTLSSGAATLASASVTGNATVGGTLGVTGATTLSSTLDVTSLASLDGGIDVDGAFTVADTSGNVSTSGTMNVDGAATFNGNVTLGNAATDTVTITADISSNMVPGADSTYDIGTTGDRWANVYADALTLTDGATVGGTLGVTGESTLASATVSDLTDNRIVIAGLAGSLEDDANLTFNGTTFEVGTAFDVVAASGNTVIGGTLDVTGTASLDGGIDVDGAFTVANTSGNISTTGTLNVDGASTLNNVTLDALSTFDAGANKLTNLADPTANQDAATKAYVDGRAISISDGTTTEALTMGDTLNVAGTANEVNVAVTATDTFTIGLPDDVTIGNNLSVTTNATVGGTLGVTGAATMSSTLGVTGVATFGSHVEMGDGDILKIGTDADLQVQHTGVAGSITNSTGTLSINGAASSSIIVNDAAADVDFIVEGSSVATLLKVDAGTDTIVVGGGVTTAGASLKINTTDSMMLPLGTTAQRPGTGAQGMFRYNTTTNGMEYHDGSSWKNVSADFTVIVADSFSGDGSTTAFTLSNTGTTATTVVSINGVVQIPTTAYGVSGTTLTFTEAPATGDVIDARVLTTTTTVTGLDDGTGTATIDCNGDGSIDMTGSVTVTGNLHATGAITADGNLTLGDANTDAITINANISSHVIPTTDVTYDLGSSSKKWRDLYLSGSTIHLGALQLKDDGLGTFGIYQSDGTTAATLSSDNVDTTQIANGTSNVAVASNSSVTVTVAGASHTVFHTDGTIHGTATSAQYADLAEKYTADADIEPGTVVCFGGEAEVTTCNHDMDTKVAGIVSTNPAHLMNAELEGGVAVALTGRVPCKVVGPVSKGDMMVSAGNGMARAEANPAMGSVIGKALGNNEDGEGIIEVVVGRL